MASAGHAVGRDVDIDESMKLKNDHYRRTRGGTSRVLEIVCSKCDALICQYQKDGSGNLRRMYLDRMVDPMVSIDKKDLRCSKEHLLGVRIVYAKENREAFRLRADSVKKRIVKNV